MGCSLAQRLSSGVLLDGTVNEFAESNDLLAIKFGDKLTSSDITGKTFYHDARGIYGGII